MNYAISELFWGMSLILYNLSDIADMRKGYSGNITRNPNFDTADIDYNKSLDLNKSSRSR